MNKTKLGCCFSERYDCNRQLEIVSNNYAILNYSGHTGFETSTRFKGMVFHSIDAYQFLNNSIPFLSTCEYESLRLSIMNKEKPEALWPAVCKHSFLRLMSCYSCRLYIGGQNCIYNHNRSTMAN